METALALLHSFIVKTVLTRFKIRRESPSRNMLGKDVSRFRVKYNEVNIPEDNIFMDNCSFMRTIQTCIAAFHGDFHRIE